MVSGRRRRGEQGIASTRAASPAEILTRTGFLRRHPLSIWQDAERLARVLTCDLQPAVHQGKLTSVGPHELVNYGKSMRTSDRPLTTAREAYAERLEVPVVAPKLRLRPPFTQEVVYGRPFGQEFSGFLDANLEPGPDIFGRARIDVNQ